MLESPRPSQLKKDLEEGEAMEQTQMLPQQSLQTIANWGMTFLAKASQEKELIQLYGKPLYDGALAVAQWWRSLSIGQIQAINQIDFPYWTITIASKLAKVPSTQLNSCLDALQKTQKSVGKLSRILNKFIAPKKLSFGREMTQDYWDLIACSLNLDGARIDEIRQLASQMNGGSTQSLTTDLVIEILTERGYPVAQILPKPRIKRLPLPEVEQLIAIKVQEAVQDREEHLLAALERSRYLESENERLMKQLRLPIQCPTTVEIVPVTEEDEEPPDVFEKCLGLWGESFKEGERVRIVDYTNNDDYGKTGIIKGQDESDLAQWWVQLSDGDYKQFPTSALELIRREYKETSISIPEQIVQKFKEVKLVKH
jgi:hypothetical protein